MMRVHTNVKKQSLEMKKVLGSLVCGLFFVCSTNSAFAADRFSPPVLNASVDSFNKRSTSRSFNVSFIVARVLNESRLIHRAGDEIRSSTAVFRGQDDGAGAISNSVLIPPGTKANTIIVINQSDGDSYAIHR